MKYEMMPVVDANELERILIAQYGPNAMGNQDFMANVLFGDEYNNDSYKSYYFQEDEEFTGKFWQDEEKIRIRNCVNSILRDLFPDQERILVDVSW